MLEEGGKLFRPPDNARSTAFGSFATTFQQKPRGVRFPRSQ